MTEWRQRAAETKKRRTREALIEAADAAIKREGVNVTAETVARDAGVGVATFYTVFPSRAAMFTELFRELIAVPHAQVVQDVLSRDGSQPGPAEVLPYRQVRARLVDVVSAFQDLTAGRTELVAGALMARLSDGRGDLRSYEELLTDGQTGSDPVGDLTYRLILSVPFTQWVGAGGVATREIDSRRLLAAFYGLHQAALLMLDRAACGQPVLPESIADIVFGSFEVSETIFDRDKTDNRGLNAGERAAIDSVRRQADAMLNSDND